MGFLPNLTRWPTLFSCPLHTHPHLLFLKTLASHQSDFLSISACVTHHNA